MSNQPGFLARWRMRREMVAQEIPIDKEKPIPEQYQAWKLRDSEQVLAQRQQARETRVVAAALQRMSWERTERAGRESHGRERGNPAAEWGIKTLAERTMPERGRERDER